MVSTGASLDEESRSASVANFIIAVVVIVATVPLTIWGARFAKRHRGIAHGAAALLLLFGMQVRIDKPPPPRIEFVRREEPSAENDEPK